MNYTMRDAEICADAILAMYSPFTPAYRFAKSVKMTVATMEILFSPNTKIKIDGFMKLIREITNDSRKFRYPQF